MSTCSHSTRPHLIETFESTRLVSVPRAFSAVELLVVISIIALLLSLLLPTVQLARETARTQVCLSNMRQTSLVTQNYADENRQYLPYSTNNTAVASQNHRRWVDFMDEYDSANISSAVPTGNVAVTNNTDGRMRRCPGGVNLACNINTNYSFGTTYINNVGGTSSITAENRFFFAPNLAQMPRDDAFQTNFPTPRRLDAIRKNLNYIAEAIDTGSSFNQFPQNVGGSTSIGGVRFRHPSNSTNLIFLDTHAETWLGADIAAAHQYNLTVPLINGHANYLAMNRMDLVAWSQNADGTLPAYPWGDSAE